MSRRLYYLMASRADAQQAVDALLVNQIDIKRIHVVAKEGVDLKSLPEASIFQKHDLRHSVFVGGAVGALLGVIIGLFIHHEFNMPVGGLMIATTLIGLLLGAWFASMIGMMTSNTELKPFEKELQAGKLLVIADVPKAKVESIEAALERAHLDKGFQGVEATKPSFP